MIAAIRLISPLSSRPDAMGNSPADPQHERICEALFEGRKIDAIRLYRELSDTGLREAKEFIDTLEARLKREQPERFKQPASPGGGCTGMLVLLAGILALGAILWFLR